MVISFALHLMWNGCKCFNYFVHSFHLSPLISICYFIFNRSTRSSATFFLREESLKILNPSSTRDIRSSNCNHIANVLDPHLQGQTSIILHFCICFVMEVFWSVILECIFKSTRGLRTSNCSQIVDVFDLAGIALFSIAWNGVWSNILAYLLRNLIAI